MSAPISLAKDVFPRQNDGVATRVQSIDILRGGVMISMALDHVRDFFHSAVGLFSPTDLSRTTAAIFLTRWITHFCAPVFMFSAGLSAFLWARRKSRSELSRFLWKRGLWLAFLELTVIQFALFFRLTFNPVILNVLWALGWSMIALGLLIYLPLSVVSFVSVAMIALHNLGDGWNASQFGALAPLWLVLHQPGMFRLGGHTIQTAYPLIPWIGVMAAGYCCGQLFALDPERRRRLLRLLGLGSTAAFIVVRAINVYGDPARWSTQSSSVFTVLSFLNTTKYPPSLDFLLMTLGPALVVLSWTERLSLSAENPLLVFGRTPFFYFIVHLFLIHACATLYHVFDPSTNGVGLGAVYVVWLAVLIVMYPLCRWFGQLKQRRRDWWLSYL